jgi:hypothetical protein
MWNSVEQLPIEVYRNSTKSVGFEVWDDVSGNAIDLTGYKIYCIVGRTDTNAVLETIQAEYNDLLGGKFSILFDGRSYSSVQGYQETVNLSYSIMAESDADGPVALIKSVLILKP